MAKEKMVTVEVTEEMAELLQYIESFRYTASDINYWRMIDND